MEIININAFDTLRITIQLAHSIAPELLPAVMTQNPNVDVETFCNEYNEKHNPQKTQKQYDC